MARALDILGPKLILGTRKQRTVQSQMEVLSSWDSQLGEHASASSCSINVQMLLWKQNWNTISRNSSGDEAPLRPQGTDVTTLQNSPSLYLPLLLPRETFIKLLVKSNLQTLPESHSLLTPWQQNISLPMSKISADDQQHFFRKNKHSSNVNSHLPLNKKEGFSTDEICVYTRAITFNSSNNHI